MPPCATNRDGLQQVLTRLGASGVARLRKLWGDGGYRGEAIVMPEIMRC